MTSHVQHVFVNGRNELEATVSFSVPPQLRKKPLAELAWDLGHLAAVDLGVHP
jgi:hypothetical protein